MTLISGLLCYKSCWLISMATRSLTSDTLTMSFITCIRYVFTSVCESEKHEGRRGQRPSLHNTSCVYELYSSDFYTRVCAWACVCARVSKQQRSESEADVKQLTLGLHVFTAVWNFSSGQRWCIPRVWKTLLRVCVRPRDVPGEWSTHCHCRLLQGRLVRSR